MEALAAGCGAVLVVVLATAVAGKARDLPGFARSPAVALLAGRWRTWAAAAILAGESAAVVLLLLPGAAWYGFAAATAVTAVLTGGVAVAVSRRIAAPCPCFGGRAEPLGPAHLARNALLTGLAALGLLATWPGRALDDRPGEVVAAGLDGRLGEVVAAGLAGVVVALLLIRLDDLRSVFR